LKQIFIFGDISKENLSDVSVIDARVLSHPELKNSARALVIRRLKGTPVNLTDFDTFDFRIWQNNEYISRLVSIEKSSIQIKTGQKIIQWFYTDDGFRPAWFGYGQRATASQSPLCDETSNCFKNRPRLYYLDKNWDLKSLDEIENYSIIKISQAVSAVAIRKLQIYLGKADGSKGLRLAQVDFQLLNNEPSISDFQQLSSPEYNLNLSDSNHYDWSQIGSKLTWISNISTTSFYIYNLDNLNPILDLVKIGRGVMVALRRPLGLFQNKSERFIFYATSRDIVFQDLVDPSKKSNYFPERSSTLNESIYHESILPIWLNTFSGSKRPSLVFLPSDSARNGMRVIFPITNTEGQIEIIDPARLRLIIPNNCNTQSAPYVFKSHTQVSYICDQRLFHFDLAAFGEY
jgi:hypothetical protein